MLELTIAELTALISLRAAQNVTQPLDSYDPIMEKLNKEYKRLQDAEEYKAKRAAEQAEREANRKYALEEAKVGDVIEYTAPLKGKEYSYGQTVTRRMVIREVHVSQNKYGARVLDITGTVLTKAGEPHKTLNTYGAYDADGVFRRNYATRIWSQDPTTVKLIQAA